MEIGIDIEEIDRIKNAHKKWGEKFLNRIYSEKELAYCFGKNNPYPSLCGRFCAKEAIIKANTAELSFRDIEILNEASGKPIVFIKRQKTDIRISISHSRKYATAVALCK